MRMQGFGWAFIACVLGLALVVVAAEPARTGREAPPPQAQASKPVLPARVTVTKTDGKVLAGMLTAADHDGILAVRQQAGDDGAAVEEVSFAHLVKTLVPIRRCDNNTAVGVQAL